eukprot:2485552-Pleurochrysis_carterae.AAC.1
MAPGIGVYHYASLTYDVRVSDFLQAVEKELNRAEECQSHPLAARQLRRGGGRGFHSCCCDCNRSAFASNVMQHLLCAMPRACGRHCGQTIIFCIRKFHNVYGDNIFSENPAGECVRITLTHMHTHTHMRTWRMHTQMHAHMHTHIHM